MSKSTPFANSTSYKDAYHIRDGRILMYQRSDVAPKIVAAIKEKHASGLSLRKIAKEVGVGVSTVQRTLKAA